ncbi:hypothetical protein LUZ61_014931 [Rhynchospora tenuis]|uniref:DUF7796 domain-containing protein n=1 Tax=Rhynchospora tenuis TaxID=198213 RepID=A0AAD5WC02_9POAL|nr:hypothetical protein LUZ61_014931 [Rhynchospora tenuis]
MRKHFQDKSLEGSVKTISPLIPVKVTLLQGRYLARPYRPILLFLLISILILTSLHYKRAPATRFSIPSTHSGTLRVAICLVGGARRFELTGPTILEHVLNAFPEADLFVHSNLDRNSFKLGLLGLAPRVTEVRIRKPVTIPETKAQRRLLSASSSSNGIQGLLQYFDLVEGCLDMIEAQEYRGRFRYDWIVRTRVDGYWTGPLNSRAFKPDAYVVPEGSRFSGLNDRLGIGNRSFSTVALSRLSLLPRLASAGFHDLNSESTFHAQLKVFNISAKELRFPFCTLSDHRYEYPPKWSGVPVASIGSLGPLSGTKCRPCIPSCKGKCMEKLGPKMKNWSGWTEWRNGSLELCDGSRPWQKGWEKIYDEVSGKTAANVRRRVKKVKIEDCVKELEELKRKAEKWNGPDPIEICNLGLVQS